MHLYEGYRITMNQNFLYLSMHFLKELQILRNKTSLIFLCIFMYKGLKIQVLRMEIFLH